MECHSKRRKLNHIASNAPSHSLIDFEARNSAQLSAANTLVLEAHDLLNESRPDAKTFEGADTLLRQIKDIIDSIEPHDAVPIAQATVQLEKTHCVIAPYPDPPPRPDAQYKVSFAKPTQCNVVGSYVSKSMIKAQDSLAIDMVVQMPKSLFQDKDYMDMRYFYRRSYYIAYIAAHVGKHLGNMFKLAFEHLNENPLLPLLLIRPLASNHGCPTSEAPHECNTPYTIRLIPCAPHHLFPWSKLTPSSNCNRQRHQSCSVPTPFYNSTLNGEQAFIPYLRFLCQARSVCPAFADACILGRIWLQQRGFGGGLSQGGFGHFEWAVLMALLLSTDARDGKATLSTSLSSTELFKAVIHFLSTTHLLKNPVVFGTSGANAKAIQQEGPVIFDGDRQLNILFKTTPWSIALLQLYAKMTTDLLADDPVDKFDAIFINKADIAPLVFDACFELSLGATTDRRNFSFRAHGILRRAYGSRAQLVHFSTRKREPWPLGCRAPDETSNLTISIIFNPAEMSRNMEYGPRAEEQEEGASFRRFWGEKAELRRFKDGRILECVEWKMGLPSEICHQVLCYSLGRHMGISSDDVVVRGLDMSTIIGPCHHDKDAYDAARRAFTVLEREMRSLEELPLQIKQLCPVSPMASYSSTPVPTLAFHGDFSKAMDVIVYFEASSKWPENLVAIQEAKIEFLLDIDKRLMAAHSNMTTSLGRENGITAIENLAYLDIVYDTGAAFRLRIHCDVEESLLERQSRNKTLNHHVREASAQARDEFCWLYKTLPLHTQTVATLCTRLEALSQSIRLVKHWFASHMLSRHFSEQLIELLALHVFLEPYPWPVPTSPTTGFLRILLFLSRWNWRDEPLIIDWADSLTCDDRAAIRNRVDLWRRRDAQMNKTVLFVATSSEPSGLAYTHKGPCRLVASRMTRLAKAACRLMRNQTCRLEAASLFQSSLRDFDVLIRLSPRAVKAAVSGAATAASGKRHSHFTNIHIGIGKTPLPLRLHPVDVLAAELQRVYQDTLVFFGGSSQDLVLAAIWNPRLQHRQKPRAGLPYNFCTEPNANGFHGDVVVNRGAILLEIARVGGDLIKAIEVLDDCGTGQGDTQL
ncbi:hypothetical protein CDD81_2617 [Ophiocordyceps australis]|uniref:U3 small nucleolar RNA-associated protein 22 n=1 Tax=Ophiocordyceps australis TaxID=1399860 RepID=A0A2C5X7I5_9HYPO|nr:hypothetical protein CDD81_2617 [Ophiocordyceps australis]